MMTSLFKSGAAQIVAAIVFLASLALSFALSDLWNVPLAAGAVVFSMLGAALLLVPAEERRFAIALILAFCGVAVAYFAFLQG